MATTANLLDQPIRPVSVDYALIQYTENGKVTLKATQNEKAIQKATAEGSVLFAQSVSYDIPNTWEGVVALDIPEEEKVNLVRQALTAKVNRGVIALLEEVDGEGNPTFQPVSGTFDARGIASAVSGRRGMTDAEKLIKTFKNLSPEIQALIAAQIGAAK